MSVASIESLMDALGPDDPDHTFARTTLNYDELVTLQTAADRLGKPLGTVRRWLSEGRFSVVGKVGRLSYVQWGKVVEAEFQTRSARGPRPTGRSIGA